MGYLNKINIVYDKIKYISSNGGVVGSEEFAVLLILS